MVEFGDVEDEFDYRQRPAKRHKLSADKSTDGKQPAASKQPMVRHKIGDSTHAETNIPANLKLDYFEASREARGWRQLGLAEGLAEHLIGLKFADPTKVQQASIPALLQSRYATPGCWRKNIGIQLIKQCCTQIRYSVTMGTAMLAK